MNAISITLAQITPNSYSWNFFQSVILIISEFIQSKNLHNETERLIDIIMRFDSLKQDLVKAFEDQLIKIEQEEFWQRVLCKIRYIFSKLGRMLNLREQTNKWLVKDNTRLLKTIIKMNPNFQQEMRTNQLKLINMDSHEWKNAKLELLFFLK